MLTTHAHGDPLGTKVIAPLLAPPTRLFTGKDAYSPERRLMAAVLEDALACFERYADASLPRQRALYRDAAEWFTSRERDSPFSFESVCAALGVSADGIRGGLSRWADARELAAAA